MTDLEILKSTYPDARSALLPILYLAQERFGCLGDEALRWVSDTLQLPQALVKGTASFYSMFKRPGSGRHVIGLCTNVSCLIVGADTLEDFLKIRYGVQAGGTSPDGRFSLVIMECIGACDGAPAMLVDLDLHVGLSEQRIEEILEEYP